MSLWAENTKVGGRTCAATTFSFCLSGYNIFSHLTGARTIFNVGTVSNSMASPPLSGVYLRPHACTTTTPLPTRRWPPLRRRHVAGGTCHGTHTLFTAHRVTRATRPDALPRRGAVGIYASSYHF